MIDTQAFLNLIPLWDPGSRLYFVSLIVSGFIALGYFLIFKSPSFSTRAMKSVFVNYWMSPSAIVDYKIFTINFFIKVLLFAPLIGFSYVFSKVTIQCLFYFFSGYASIKGNGVMFFLATLFAFLWDDFLRFFHHYLMHKIPVLWSLHKTHHSASVLTPITLYRIHPIESAIATLRNAMSLGVSVGVFMFIFSGQVELIQVLGVNIFAFLFNLTFGNLRHSHLEISFGIFEKLFISPKQHQIHHSNRLMHYDKNFGVVLSLWDQLFGTYLSSQGQSVKGFGVDGVEPGSLATQFIRLPRPPSDDYGVSINKVVQ